MENKYTGNDNYGNPKSNYIEEIKNMDDEKLYSETYSMIYHSARCNNNIRADWHWKVDVCYDEWIFRNKPTEYKRAFDKVKKDYCG